MDFNCRRKVTQTPDSGTFSEKKVTQSEDAGPFSEKAGPFSEKKVAQSEKTGPFSEKKLTRSEDAGAFSEKKVTRSEKPDVFMVETDGRPSHCKIIDGKPNVSNIFRDYPARCRSFSEIKDRKPAIRNREKNIAFMNCFIITRLAVPLLPQVKITPRIAQIHTD